jgi:hypothetical protein
MSSIEVRRRHYNVTFALPAVAAVSFAPLAVPGRLTAGVQVPRRKIAAVR